MVHLHIAEVSAGCSFIRSTLDSFRVPSTKGTVLIDMFAYDSFAMMAALEVWYNAGW